jgi:hypothetical protein
MIFKKNFTVQLSGTKRWTMQKGIHPSGMYAALRVPPEPSTATESGTLDPYFEFDILRKMANAIGEESAAG